MHKHAPVDGQSDEVYELYLQLWNVRPLPVHHDLWLVAHGLFEVTLAEEL
jgi:hypothetical protein